jgi:hypothetical protein
MNKVITFVGILIAIVIIAVSAFSLVSSVSDIAVSMNSITNAIQTFGDDRVGASGTRLPNGVSADTTSPVAGELRGTTFTLTGDATFGGGDGGVVVTTSNTATSSVEVGCIQMTATSTASPIKLVPATYATTTATFGLGTAAFPVVAVFGTCP